jgi:hypothetical protein
MPDVEALVFDTFGTVVDWRNGVAREAERILKPMGYNLDWLAFADAWRKEYGPGMERSTCRRGGRGRTVDGRPMASPASAIEASSAAQVARVGGS